jgi:hypothetical protein
MADVTPDEIDDVIMLAAILLTDYPEATFTVNQLVEKAVEIWNEIDPTVVREGLESRTYLIKTGDLLQLR